MKPKRRAAFDVESFLLSEGIVNKSREFRPNEVIASQGETVGNVLYYVRKGSVKRSVVSYSGKERVVSILGRGDFIGMGCLSELTVRPASVTAILPTSVLEIGKKNMIRALHAHTAFADHFRNYLLGRNVRSEEDLIDHLFNPGEKRLARLLLKLNEFGGRHNFDTALPKVSQQLLAEMIGASRQQVNALMNKFKKLGFIEYDGGLTIHRSLATVMLSD